MSFVFGYDLVHRGLGLNSVRIAAQLSQFILVLIEDVAHLIYSSVHYAFLPFEAIYFLKQPLALPLQIHVFLHRLSVLVGLHGGVILFL